MLKLSMGTLVLAGAALLASQSESSAAISNPLDSSAFTYKYEGDAITIAPDGVTGSGFGNTGYSGIAAGTGVSVSSDGNYLTYTTSVAFGGVFESSLFPTVVTLESGWTWEMRFRIDSMLDQWAMLARIGPAVNNSTATAHEVFRFTDSAVIALASGEMTAALQPNTFHTLRIAQAAGNSEYNVWFDQSLAATFTLGDDAEDVIVLGGVNPWWGDGSGNGGGTVVIDHIRFTSGGYSPVPEPATLSLLSLGALSMIRRRK